MLGLLAFIGGILALVWTGIVASVGLAILFVLLLPLLVLALLFRLSFALIKLAAVFLLLCFAAVWFL